MKIYFRDNGKIIEYSLDEFVKEETYEYSEFDISDDYSDEEAEVLCYRMINEFEINGISLNVTLENEINKRNMFIESMKFFDKFRVINSNVSNIHFSVYLVHRGNFNDEMLIESIDVSVDSLKDKELTWFDLYLNKKNDNNIKIAPVYLENNELYFLENNDGVVNVVKKNGFTKYYSDDYNDSYIISTQIYCRK